MDKKMFFFDIDGTLIECVEGIYELNEQTMKSLDSLKAYGHDVFLATGRCPCFIVDGVMKYDFSGYVTCNGAYVTYKGEEVFKRIIPSKAIDILDELSRQRGLTYFLEGVDHIYVKDCNEEMLVDFCNDWQMKHALLIDQYDSKEIETFIAMLCVNNEEDVTMVEEVLSPYFTIQRHMHGYSFDLTIKGVSKGMGIKELCKAINREMNDTVAFGDGLNDVEMLESVGFSIAMDNACDEAKRVSNYVTKSVLENGVCYAIDELGYVGE